MANAEHHEQAAQRHEQAAQAHDRSATFWEGRGDGEQAGLQRKLADYERLGAQLERQWGQLTNPSRLTRARRGSGSAVDLMRKNAQLLSAVLIQTADALEQTAVLADEHAALAGQRDSAQQERQVAGRAREFANRARTQAGEWQKLGNSSGG